MANQEELLTRLQDWFYRGCDGDWEHQWGIRINTVDNPGWLVEIDMEGIDVPDDAPWPLKLDRSEDDWVRIYVTDVVLKGACGPRNLSELLRLLLDWLDVVDPAAP